MERVPFSLRRIGLIADNTLREAVRQKTFAGLLFLSMAVVVGARQFRDFNFGAPELKFIADLGFGVIGLFGAVLAITVMAQLFFSEIEGRTVQTLLARPVWRAEFVLGKFLGAAGIVAAYCVTLTALLAAVLWSRETALRREIPEAFPHGHALHYAWLAGVGLLLWLKLLVTGALTLLVACYARGQAFAVITGCMLFVACHLQYLAHNAAIRTGTTFTRALAELLGMVLPNFQLFDEAGLAAVGGGLAWDYVGKAALYALGWTAVACTLAVACFERREI